MKYMGQKFALRDDKFIYKQTVTWALHAGVVAKRFNAGLLVTRANFNMTMKRLAQVYQQSIVSVASTPAYHLCVCVCACVCVRVKQKS
jgi:hypothetical protein